MISEVISPSTHFKIPSYCTGDYRIMGIKATHEQEKYLANKGKRVGTVYRIHEYNLRMTPFFKEFVNQLFRNDLKNPVFTSVINLNFQESFFLWFRTALALEMTIQFAIRDDRYEYITRRSDTAQIFWEHIKS